MATVLAPPKPKTPAGGPPPPIGGDGDGRGGRDGSIDAIRRYRTGMWLALGAVTMVFAGFTSAYVIRRGGSNDWRPLHVPAILWGNTLVLAASSLTVERARRRLNDAGPLWLGITSALGALFLIGQYTAWQELRAAGIYLASNPSSSFFYLLTGSHALHLLGGVLALFYVAGRVWVERGWSGRAAAVEATSLYWHFMDALWIYVFLLVFVWR